MARIAFSGFRHGHILSLYAAVAQRDELDLVGACETHEATRRELDTSGKADFTHESLDALLAEGCDILAVGDTYARRGDALIAGLEAGCHVIADKPLCASLAAVDRIEALAAEKGLRVGCMLTMRDGPFMRTTRRLLREGAIGNVHAIQFGGQHPLLLGSRPSWYFEPGEHGGTINDIGIHAIDGIPWATGLAIQRVEAARCWNAFAPESPHFGDGAQMMLTLSNGAGVVGDVSYFAPDKAGYSMPYYWRMTWWGREGVLEGGVNLPLTLLRAGDEGVSEVPLDGKDRTYLDAFLDDIAGNPPADGALTTAQVITSSRTALQIQAAADEGRTQVDLA